MLNKLKFLSIPLITLAITGCSSYKSPSLTDTPQPTVTKINRLAAAKTNAELGYYYIQQGNYQRAHTKLLTSLQEAPNYPPANSAMGYFLETTGETTRAKEYYMRSIQLTPNDGSMHNNYGAFLCRQKDYNEALQQFKLAIADKNYVNVAEAYENAGLCAQQIPKPKLARHFFLKAIQHNPSLPISLLELTKLNYHMKQYAKANYYLKQYLEIASPTKTTTKLKLAINQKLEAHA